MDRYLGGEEIDVKVLIADLETAVAARPAVPGDPGVHALRRGHRRAARDPDPGVPRPGRAPAAAVFTVAGARVDDIGCDPDGPLLAEVVKTTTDPYLGRVSLVRVFSGTLRAEQVVHVSGHSSQFRARRADAGRRRPTHDDRRTPTTTRTRRSARSSSPLGKTLRPVPYCVAGDLCVGRAS